MLSVLATGLAPREPLLRSLPKPLLARISPARPGPPQAAPPAPGRPGPARPQPRPRSPAGTLNI